MRLNQDKCHLLILGHKYESVWANIGSWKIWESNDQKNLGVIIDINLTLIDVCGRGVGGVGSGNFTPQLVFS